MGREALVLLEGTEVAFPASFWEAVAAWWTRWEDS